MKFPSKLKLMLCGFYHYSVREKTLTQTHTIICCYHNNSSDFIATTKVYYHIMLGDVILNIRAKKFYDIFLLL